MQAQAAAELDALLPSLLDRAFRGEYVAAFARMRAFPAFPHSGECGYLPETTAPHRRCLSCLVRPVQLVCW